MKKLLLSFIAFAGITGAASAQTSSSPFTSAVRYDALGRVTGMIEPDPDGGGPLGFATKRNTYNANGNVVKVEQGELSTWQSENVEPSAWSGFTILSSTETSYDAMGRKLKDVQKGSDGVAVVVTQYSYDTAGRLECTTVRMNPSVYGSLPASACTLGVEGSQGPDRITRNVYDVAGKILIVQQAFGTPLQQDYVTYTYTNNGKQASVKDANGNLASLTYDGHDRLLKWSFPSKTSTGSVSTTDYEQYGYDANGNKTSYRKRDGWTLTYAYDALNRMTVKTVPERSGLNSTHTRDVYYGYDLRGLQLYARYDSTTGEGVASSYDGFGRLASTSLTMDGVTRTLNYQRDKDGNRTELTWPDNNKTSYSYDGLDRMGTLYEGAIGSTVNMLTYGYNNRGLRSNQTGRYGQATSFSYDAIGRLNSFGHNFAGTGYDVSYGASFSPANQIVSRTTSNDAYAWTGAVSVSRSYAVNGLNQYTSVAGGGLTYDDNGNLTSSGTVSYVYDVENRLVSANGGTTAGLRYDPLGRLYEVTGASGTTRFLYGGDELVAEYNSSGTLLRRYAHGTSVDDPVVWYEGSGLTTPRWLHTNWQGSVVAVTDSSASSIATNSYDEWGIPAATNQGRFQYTGQAWIPEIGMYYYKARIYSPTLGRFMQTDPIGYKDQVNLYAYVGNNPVNMNDPAGLYKCTGTTAQCEDVKIYMENLREAYENSIVTGSRIGDVQLKRAINFIGTDNGKGPEIGFGSLPGGQGGEYSDGKITLDNNKLNQVAGEASKKLKMSFAVAKGHIGASVLAHEATHGTTGGGGSTGYGHFWNEVPAYQTGYFYFHYMGVVGGPFGSPFAMRQIGNDAFGSCIGAVRGKADPGNVYYNSCAQAHIDYKK